jgi:hypothetical protein
MAWEIACHPYGSDSLTTALRLGWEPFGVTGEVEAATIWVRRSVTALPQIHGATDILFGRRMI